VALSVAWVSAVALAHPAGNFPLNDDWSYAMAVKRLIEQGGFHPTGWTSMPLVSHVLWGALFCVPAGFSFNALRLSTLCLSLAGIVALYLLVRARQHPRWTALLAAATLAFNPIYFALSHTFMTDVPFTALTVVAVLCLARCVQLRSTPWWFAGAAAASAATLCRHVGLLLSPAFVFVAASRRPWRSRGLGWALAVLAPGLGALLVYAAVFGWTVGPRAWYRPVISLVARLVRNPFAPLWNGVVLVLYLGLFMAPLVLAQSRRGWLSRVAGGLVVAIVLLATGRAIPFVQNGNILVAQGIGPLTLRDTHILKLPDVAPLPGLFWAVVTALGAVAGIAVVERVPRVALGAWQSLRGDSPDRAQTTTTVALLGTAAALAIPFVVLGGFDRYLLPLVPLVAVLMLARPSDQRNELETQRPRVPGIAALGIAALGLMAMFSVASTHDYLAWNRARWEALTGLTSKQDVSPRQIDGGFEFNGWNLYAQDYRREESKSWWWVDDDLYVVAFGTIPGYEVVARHSYSRWLPPRTDNILTLRRLARH
jgi:4-amino-4-deoxy-L-arabinose transferase-like glycosyltransferase